MGSIASRSAVRAEWAPPTRKRGIGAGKNHQVQLRRQVVKQKGECLLDYGRSDDMQVIQHKNVIVWKRFQFVKDG